MSKKYFLRMSKKKKEEKVVCDRCGNHEHIRCSLWFAFKKVRIYLCDICWLGLCVGLKLDIEAHFAFMEKQNKNG